MAVTLRSTVGRDAEVPRKRTVSDMRLNIYRHGRSLIVQLCFCFQIPIKQEEPTRRDGGTAVHGTILGENRELSLRLVSCLFGSSHFFFVNLRRSEERRVGKECRSRCVP